jgi:hypothetical protein
MTLYSAHLIRYLKVKDGDQARFPVEETAYLIDASSPDDAFDQAEAIGQEINECDNEDFTWENRPAKWIYAGIRKLLDQSCFAPDHLDREDSFTFKEITYSEFMADRREALQDLIEGRPVTIATLNS